MINSDENICMLLKKYNVWFHTNNYFLINILSIRDRSKLNDKYILNQTENDVYIIPVVETDTETILDRENIITICVGDIEEVNVFKEDEQIGLSIDVVGNKTVNVLTHIDSETQKKNLVHFVENFKNTGAELLFESKLRDKGIFEDNVSKSAKWYLDLSILCILFFAAAQTFFDPLTNGNEIVLGFIRVWLFIAAVCFFALFMSKVIKEKKKEEGNGLYYEKAPKRKTFSQMTQEEREEVREKRSEDELTSSSGPIITDDENYGGIKKM